MLCKNIVGEPAVAGANPSQMRYLGIKVEDTGTGMNSEQRNKLFKMFGMTGDAHIGTSGIGVGLTVCKAIVERMGGCIKVDSVIQ